MDVRIYYVLLSVLFITDIKCDMLGDFASGGHTGRMGAPGIPGLKGDRGPRGPKGPKGDNCDPCMRRIDDDMGLGGLKGQKGDEGISGFPGLPGVKGDMGISGVPGLPGEKGDMGISGFPGLPGVKGDMGISGVPGLPGEKGDMGISGFPGLPGVKGDMGIIGLPGLSGLPGLKGNVGAPGMPGLPGVCMQRCPASGFDSDTDDSEESLSEVPKAFGEESRPSPTTCRNAPDKITGTDYWVMPKNKFLVTCNNITNRTCLKINEDLFALKKNSIKYESMTKTFWLSQLGFDLLDFYKISMDQLHWLQTQSNGITQVIRYHCKNSYITSDHIDKALRLLTWNDIVVGPYPSEVTPLFYSIFPENHGCKPGADDSWHYADIYLVDTTSKRLPVIDFYIRDVGRGDQQVYLELRELCFG